MQPVLGFMECKHPTHIFPETTKIFNIHLYAPEFLESTFTVQWYESFQNIVDHAVDIE